MHYAFKTALEMDAKICRPYLTIWNKFDTLDYVGNVVSCDLRMCMMFFFYLDVCKI